MHTEKRARVTILVLFSFRNRSKSVKELDSGSGHVDVILLDFSKAFDVEPHSRLLTKLKAYGITQENINWIRSFW